jgi:hypothetical protein
MLSLITESLSFFRFSFFCETWMIHHLLNSTSQTHNKGVSEDDFKLNSLFSRNKILTCYETLTFNGSVAGGKRNKLKEGALLRYI